jgi:DNA-binding transcriptional regulator YiaG
MAVPVRVYLTELWHNSIVPVKEANMSALISFNSYFHDKMKDPEFVKLCEESDIQVRFAVSLAMQREKRKLTQAQLSERLGVSQPMVARWEKGHIPNVKTLALIAHALGGVFTIGPNGAVEISDCSANK